jgi:exodeoxyribonuclease VII large subunit
LFEGASPATVAARLSSPARELEPEPARVFSVGQLGRLLRSELEGVTNGVQVGGEIGGLREVTSGHAYFTLRDEREEAVLDCVMYRTAPVRARKLLADGARLVLTGRVTFYAPRGRVQLVVDGARPAGRGALLEGLEKLKAKLRAEGLFAEERKRRLPAEPRVIGVVTSLEGAALPDIVRVAFRRAGVRVIVAPAQVQGPGAAESLARALRAIARHPEIEVVILGRGGGSAEDLAAFNDEALVRAVAECPVPVVAAVGHEIDVSLVDLAADVRAATPSQAAELVVPDESARLLLLLQYRARLARAARRHLDERVELLDDLEGRLGSESRMALSRRREALARLERRLGARHPAAVLAVARASIEPLRRRMEAAALRNVGSRRALPGELSRRAEVAMRSLLVEGRGRLGSAAAQLDALSPLAVLGRGYAVVKKSDGRIVRRPTDVEHGERVEVRLAEGELAAIVDRDEP